MICYEYDAASLAKVEKQLGKMKSEAPKALKNGINKTARKARTDLKNGVRQVYYVKAGKVSSAMHLYSANVGNLEAEIKVRGSTMSITEYHATTPKGGAKAAQKKGGLKQLVGSLGAKAWGSGGLIWQRKTEERYPVKTIQGSSVPVLLRPEGEVFGKVEPTISKNLEENVQQQVQRILNSA